jgi:acyl carrier protein
LPLAARVSRLRRWDARCAREPAGMTPGTQELEARLLQLVQRRLGVSAAIDDPLAALGVDSLQLADFVADLEREFRIRADQDIFEVQTLRELARYLHARRL